MYARGHYGLAWLPYAPLGAVTVLLAPTAVGVFLATVGFVGVSVAATLPDVDLRLVRLQYKIPAPIRRRLPYRISHRGITHTVAFGVVSGLLTGVGAGAVVFPLLEGATNLRIVESTIVSTTGRTSPLVAAVAVGGYFAGGVCLGVLAHLLGDVITPAGLRPLRPFDDRRVRYVVEPFPDSRVARLLAMVVVVPLGGELADSRWSRSHAANPLWNDLLFLVGIAALCLGLLVVTTVTVGGPLLELFDSARDVVGLQ